MKTAMSSAYVQVTRIYYKNKKDARLGWESNLGLISLEARLAL